MHGAAATRRVPRACWKTRHVVHPPSRAVALAFSADDEPVALAGGEGGTFRTGGVVLKHVHDDGEAVWTQDLLSKVDQIGFRVPTPIRTTEGLWVCDGWTASEFLPGLQSAVPRWSDIAAWGLRFMDAAERVRSGPSEALRGRDHRWAVADRVAWGEADVDLSPEARGCRSRSLLCCSPIGHPESTSCTVISRATCVWMRPASP